MEQSIKPGTQFELIMEKCYRTNKYGLFSFYVWNREIKQYKLNGILDLMSKYGFQREEAILVDKDLFIIDGQRRFTAAKHLGIDFYFKVISAKRIEEILESKKREGTEFWDTNDYIHYHAVLGFQEYKRFMALLEKYQSIDPDFDWKSLLNYIYSGYYSSNHREKIEKGRFEFPPDEIIDRRLRRIKDVSIIDQKIFKERTFKRAMLKLIAHPSYNHEHFVKKISFLSVRIRPCITARDYLSELITAYNHKTKPEFKINIEDFHAHGIKCTGNSFKQ